MYNVTFYTGFQVEASNEEEALEKANLMLNEEIESGWLFPLNEKIEKIKERESTKDGK